MNKFDTINFSSKREYCSHVYNSYVLDAANVLVSCRSYAALFRTKLPISCYTNFRDALFHFYKMNSCAVEIEVCMQAFAIKEHLSRAVTDATNTLLIFFASLLENLILSNSVPAMTERFREFLHSLKQFQLFKRMNGMMIFDLNRCIVTSENSKALDLIEEFCVLIQENCLQETVELCMCNQLDKK